jgi:hypothetical protein
MSTNNVDVNVNEPFVVVSTDDILNSNTTDSVEDHDTYDDSNLNKDSHVNDDLPNLEPIPDDDSNLNEDSHVNDDLPDLEPIPFLKNLLNILIMKKNIPDLETIPDDDDVIIDRGSSNPIYSPVKSDKTEYSLKIMQEMLDEKSLNSTLVSLPGILVKQSYKEKEYTLESVSKNFVHPDDDLPSDTMDENGEVISVVRNLESEFDDSKSSEMDVDSESNTTLDLVIDLLHAISLKIQESDGSQDDHEKIIDSVQNFVDVVEQNKESFSKDDETIEEQLDLDTQVDMAIDNSLSDENKSHPEDVKSIEELRSDLDAWCTMGTSIVDEMVNDDELTMAIENSLSDEIDNDELDENGNSMASENGLLSNIQVHDDILGNLDLAHCDWGYKEGKIFNPQTDRYSRRGMRKPLTDVACPETLYSFIMCLLNTALELELELPDDQDERYFAFDPYNKNSYGREIVDEFSTKSFERKIGIKTRLRKEAANVILTCYYVLYNNFKMTTDEIVFEDLYREGVLMQDDNFDLAKFYERISTGDLSQFEPLKCLMAECLELKPFPDRIVQFNAWTLTYSKQSKEVTSNNPTKLTGYLSIFDLIAKYDHEWFVSVVYPKPIETTVVPLVVESVKDYVVTDTIMDQCNAAIDSLSQMASEIKSSSDNTEEQKDENVSLLTESHQKNDFGSPINSVPSTPMKSKSKGGLFNTVDKTINGFLSYFKSKND